MESLVKYINLSPVLSCCTLMAGMCLLAFYIGRLKISYQSRQPGCKTRALSHFYGLCLASWTFSAGLVLLLAGIFFQLSPLLFWAGTGCGCLIVLTGGAFILTPDFHARLSFESTIGNLLKGSAAIAILITLAIFILLMLESLHFFKWVPLSEFLFGTHWSPPTSLGQLPESVEGHYGVLPLLCGTLLITLIAMAIAVPLGLLIAIYTAEYASLRQRRIIKPFVEILAGVPTIIYGFFALIAVAPLLHKVGRWLGMPIAAESALGAGLVMGLMIIPFISSLSDDALSSIPRSMRENSWALGATPAETTLKVIMPAALPGIASAILLAFSRAIGETMLVVMAAGLTAHLTLNPLDSVTTITVQIVTLLTGDQEFNSPKTLSAFALSLLLFLGTFILNIIAARIMRWHREKYAL